ncbi:MAG: hypothetical protein E7264_00220 [Lachnospiraceae bacterium]|nr:hypothetical protein [Lachnospiraceae bacterium]
MEKRLQSALIMFMIVLTVFTCIRIDNTSDIIVPATESYAHTDMAVMVDSASYAMNDGYNQIQQQDYWASTPSTRLATTLFKRAQVTYKNYEKNGLTIAVLDLVSKVVLFSFIMILFAASGTGLSMPFRCLLYYIQDKDGKKKIA